MYTIVKLLTGEELIGIVKESNGNVAIEEPFRIEYAFNPLTGGIKVAMAQYMPFGSTRRFVFNKAHITTTQTAGTDVSEYYIWCKENWNVSPTIQEHVNKNIEQHKEELPDDDELYDTMEAIMHMRTSNTTIH